MGDGSSWDTCPLEGHCNDFPFPRAPGGARALEVENAPLLEASRGSWKQGGARSQEGYKGTQSAVLRWKSGGSLGGLRLGRRLGLGRSVCLCGGRGLWRSGPWSDPCIGACSRWRVQASRRRRGLEAQLCQLCRANLRVRVRRAGESSPATRKARAQPRLR